jgi:hypothetical protein
MRNLDFFVEMFLSFYSFVFGHSYMRKAYRYAKEYKSSVINILCVTWVKK